MDKHTKIKDVIQMGYINNIARRFGKCQNIMTNPYYILFFVVVAVFSTFGYLMIFEGKSLISNGSPWLDKGSNIWINAATAKYIHIQFQNFEFPLWGKGIGIGVPLFSDPNNSFFSPFSFLLYLFPNSYGWDILILLRVFLLIVFSYLLFSYLDINKWIAIFCATLFGYSGHVFYFIHIMLMNSLVFTPLFLLGIIYALEKKNKNALICISISFPLMLFGGGLLDVVLISICSIFVIIIKVISDTVFLDSKDALMKICNIVLIVGVAVALSAIFILPYLELRSVSIPPYSGRSTAVFNSITYFFGLFFNKICVTPDDKSHYYMNFRQYLHILCVPGFILSLCSVFSKRQRFKYVILGSCIFFFFYFFKLYDFTFIQFINEVPVLQDIRFEKYQGTFNLSFYLLSAIGFNFLLTYPKKWKQIVFILLSLLISASPVLYARINGLAINGQVITYSLIPLFIVLIYLFNQIWAVGRPHKFVSCFTILLLTIVVLFQIRTDMVTKIGDRTILFPESSIYDELKKQAKDSRVLPMIGEAPRIWSANGINDVRNISVVSTERYYNFFKKYVEHNTCWHSLMLCSKQPDKVDLSMAEFIGVKYIVIHQSQLNALLRNHYKDYQLVKRIDNILIYELSNPTPKFYATNDAIVLSPDEIVKKIVVSPPHVHSKVYLEQPVLLEKKNNNNVVVSFKNTTWTNNRIAIEVTANNEAILILNSQFFPGWNAFINGEKTSIFRANYLFKAVKIPRGKSMVEFVYFPKSLTLGFWGSLAGLFLLMYCFNYYRKKENKPILPGDRQVLK